MSAQMTGLALLICLCSLASLPSPGEGGIFRAIVRNVVSVGLGITQKILDVSAPAMKIGGAVIDPPLQAAEYSLKKAEDITSLGFNIPKKLLKGIMGKIKAIHFPSKNSLLFILPRGIISLVDSATSKTIHIALNALKLVDDTAKATLALSIYASLKIFFAAITLPLQVIGNCTSIPPSKIHVGNVFISEIRTSKGIVCGISHLTPEHNVTVAKNGKNFLVVTVPFKIPDLVVKFDSVEVPRFIEKVPLYVTIKRVEVDAKITFTKGSILNFVKLQIRLKYLKNFEMKFLDSKPTYMEQFVESFSPAIGNQVKHVINKRFEKLGKLVYNTMLGK